MPPAILITGASKRIGKAIALGMAEDGYTIVLHYRQSVEAAGATAEAIRKTGGDCFLMQADLADTAAVKGLVQQTFKEVPECRHVINSASLFEAGKLHNTTEAQFDHHLSVNLKAPFFLTQSFAALCPEEGSVINLLDSQILSNTTTHFAYALSKKMLYEFTKMAAIELAPQIRVNGVCPGLILPPEGKDETYLTLKSQTIPLQRVGGVSDIVQAVRYFRDNRFITGDCLFLDGGEHLG